MDIHTETEAAENELIERRRDFHKYPESAWLEYRTASIVAKELKAYGFEVYAGKKACATDSRMGVPNAEVLRRHEERALAEGADPYWIEEMTGGHTAVVGVLKTMKPGPVVALRFDMDSLDMMESSDAVHRPIQEGFPSCHDGMMHACGHDGHTTIGLGVAKIVAKQRDQLTGEVRLLFQPGEEGCRGANSMVDAGWLDGVNYFFSGHIAFQSFKIGEVVGSVGGFLATTKINVTYRGIAAHAGDKPQVGKNALLAAAAASLHLNGITRHSDGKTRVNVGTLHAGSGRNVIPDKAVMEIETRGGTTDLNEFMTQEAIRIIESAAMMYDVTCEWEIVGKAPGAMSSQDLIPLIQSEVEKIDRVNSFVPYMDLNGSEDAVYMINKVQEQGGKATYLLFGSPLKAGHHQVLFDFDEDVLLIGVEVFTRLVFACPEWQ